MSGAPIIIRTKVNRDFALKIIGNLKIDPDRPLEVLIQQHRPRRSLSQNALYWKWLGIISVETGNDPDDLHEFFKREYAEPRSVSVKGEDFSVYSTAKMSVEDMSKYMERVFTFAAHEGIVLPVPEERFAA